MRPKISGLAKRESSTKLSRFSLPALFTAVFVVFGFAGAALADHGNTHASHYGFPAVPNGLNQITNTFGAACNSQANDNSAYRTDDDNGNGYWVRYHKELGPAGNSNALTSVFWHLQNEQFGSEKEGIFGYNCRKISGTNKWSTHAWGIAVDTNTVPNHQWLRHCHHHDLTWGLRQDYKDHNFQEISCDAGHFQYATGY